MLTKEERETILLTSMADEYWNLCTYDPSLIRKFKEYSSDLRRNCRLINEDKDLGFAEFEISKKSLRLGVKKPKTEAQREAAKKSVWRMLEVRNGQG